MLAPSGPPSCIGMSRARWSRSPKSMRSSGPWGQVADAAARDLVEALGDMADRQQIAECVRELKRLSGRVGEISDGLTDDRQAMIDGPLNLAKAVLESGDRDYVSKVIAEPVPFVSIGAEQVRKTVERNARAFGEIPDSRLSLMLKVMWDPGWIDKMNDDFDDL